MDAAGLAAGSSLALSDGRDRDCRRARGSRQCGLTTIELVVAITVVGVLVALLLPAIQSVREASRQVACRNNIKQLALAMQTYESAHTVFPLSYGRAGFSNDSVSASWLQSILPHIDEGGLYAELRFGKPLKDASNTAVARTVVPDFLCPSDTDDDGLMSFRSNVPGIWAINNYKACAGSNWDWGPFSPVVTTRGRNANNPDGLDHGNGIIWRGYGPNPPATRQSDLRDGAGHTFAVGESVPLWCRHTWWYWFNATTATCAIPLNYRKEPDLQVAGEGAWFFNYSFLSRHPGGANFGFADGAVRFVSDSIDLSVYRGLATIQGGEVPMGF